MERLFQLARELASSKVWSAGVEIARTGEFQRDESGERDELCWRLTRGPRDRVCRVVLSEQNELWQCDCGSEDDPCAHIVATILAVRQGKDGQHSARGKGGSPATVVHELRTSGSFLSFNRTLLTSAGERSVVAGSLVRAVAEFSKLGKSVSLTESEERIDHALAGRYSGVLEPKTMRRLIPALSRTPHVEFDGARVFVASEALPVEVEVVDDLEGEAPGFRVRRANQQCVERLFDNSAAIKDGRLYAVEDSALSSDDIALLRGPGTFFPISKGLELATQLLPALTSKVMVVIRSDKIPRARRVPPRVVIQTQSDDSGAVLTVIPHLIYGEPMIARVAGSSLELVDAREVPIRDVLEESRLVRDVAARLSLRIGEARAFHGEAAVHFSKRLSGWKTSGNGTSSFLAEEKLAPCGVGSAEGLDLHFESASGGVSSAQAVIEAWRRGESFVPLLGGGWAGIPSEWLAQHGETLARILEAKQPGEKLRPDSLSDVAELCDSLGIACPDYFETLRRYLERIDAIPDFEIPTDVRADLRDYQHYGVNWLGLLKENRLGALLADDMGLGKTIQTLCVIQSGTLIVCPTSVISSWREHFERFRPSLRVSLYHGPQRHLDDMSDVVLTSYAILRLDQDVLRSKEWEVVVLDESQTIRNAESQVAQAAYSLRARWRVSLSGTPVENSLEDLWSQFHFLNPGLLGSMNDFDQHFVQAINRGDALAARRLKSRVGPFILRRMKSEVAKELPPKTEVELQCELSHDERLIYSAIRDAARSELLERIQASDGVFSMLEVLLRLRQACCHRGLVPGHSAESSSKVDLLVETLMRSKAQGHRCLVFSQWTSLLDLVEPQLARSGLTFCRIDGSIADRGSVVESFQRPGGPDLMLLSLKAGGVGLTLTAADHVFILDPWWNPAVEDQAADRAYRIGQENPVLVHRLVAQDTIEERIMALQRHKRALLASAIGEQSSPELSRDELLALISE